MNKIKKIAISVFALGIFSIPFAPSALAVCDVNTPGDCATEVACEGVNLYWNGTVCTSQMDGFFTELSSGVETTIVNTFTSNIATILGIALTLTLLYVGVKLLFRKGVGAVKKMG